MHASLFFFSAAPFAARVPLNTHVLLRANAAADATTVVVAEARPLPPSCTSLAQIVYTRCERDFSPEISPSLSLSLSLSCHACISFPFLLVFLLFFPSRPLLLHSLFSSLRSLSLPCVSLSVCVCSCLPVDPGHQGRRSTQAEESAITVQASSLSSRRSAADLSRFLSLTLPVMHGCSCRCMLMP